MRFEKAWRKLERRVGEVSVEARAAIALGFVRQWCDSTGLDRIMGIDAADVGSAAVEAIRRWGVESAGRWVYPEILAAFSLRDKGRATGGRRKAAKPDSAEPSRFTVTVPEAPNPHGLPSRFPSAETLTVSPNGFRRSEPPTVSSTEKPHGFEASEPPTVFDASNPKGKPSGFLAPKSLTVSSAEKPEVKTTLPHPDGSAGSRSFAPEVYDEPGEWIEPVDPWDPFCRRWHRWRAVEPPQDRQTAVVVEWIALRDGPQGLSRSHWLWWLRSLPALPPEDVGVEPDAVLDWLRRSGELPLPPLPPPEDPAYDAALRSLPCAPVNPEAGTTAEAVRVFERYSEAVGNDAERAKGIMRIVSLIGGSICGSVDPDTLIRAAENYGRELPNDREAGRRKTAASFYGDAEQTWRLLGDPSYVPRAPRMAEARKRRKAASSE